MELVGRHKLYARTYPALISLQLVIIEISAGLCVNKMVQFPHNFLLGAATSAYQVEGNNINSDWWEWEKKIGLKETSGLACRHYEL